MQSQIDGAALPSRTQRVLLYVTRWIAGIGFAISLISAVAFFTITSLYPQAHWPLFGSVALSLLSFALWLYLGRKIKLFEHMDSQGNV
jgi:hypothetical protein